MIHLAPSSPPLSSLERFGLTVLVDASGLLLVEAPSPRIITLHIGQHPGNDLASLRIEQGPGEVRVSREALERLGALAGAVREQQSVFSDKHGRVPSTANPMVEAGDIRAPLINAAGRALRDAVVAQSADRAVRVIAPWPQGRRWAAAFTHDLDVVGFWPLFTALRLAELSRKGQVGLALQVAGSAIRSVAANPVEAGVGEILRVELDLGIASTWFILAGVPSLRSISRGDVTYAVGNTRARRILESVQAGGHEIGLHGSFATMSDAEAMSRERERLRQVTGKPVRGIRQHFLRMRPGLTHRAMAAAGFGYDATYGFPDRNGFRLGSALPVPAWDAESGRTSALEEVPLVWMDRAQSKYAGNEHPGDWADEGLGLAEICREVEGLWVGLWHPNLTTALGFPGAAEQYRRLASEIMKLEPFVAPLDTLVSWRRARRSIVARQVAPDGTPELRATVASEWPLQLEDGRGRVLETLAWPAAA